MRTPLLAGLACTVLSLVVLVAEGNFLFIMLNLVDFCLSIFRMLYIAVVGVEISIYIRCYSNDCENLLLLLLTVFQW